MKKSRIIPILISLIFIIQLGIPALAATDSELTYKTEANWTLNAENENYVTVTNNNGGLQFSATANTGGTAVKASAIADTVFTDAYKVSFTSALTGTDENYDIDKDIITLGSGANGEYKVIFDTASAYVGIYEGEKELAASAEGTAVLPKGNVEISTADGKITVKIDNGEVLSYALTDAFTSYNLSFGVENTSGKSSAWNISDINIYTVEPITNEEIVAAVKETATKTIINENFDDSSYDVSANWTEDIINKGSTSDGLSPRRYTVHDGRFDIANAMTYSNGGSPSYGETLVTANNSAVTGANMYLTFDYEISRGWNPYAYNYDYAKINLGALNGKTVAINAVNFTLENVSENAVALSGLDFNKSIKVELYKYNGNALIYVNGSLAAHLQGADANNFVPTLSVWTYHNWNTDCHVYLDNIKLYREASIEETATWYLVNEDFAKETDKIENVRISDDLSYEYATYDNESAYKMTVGLRGFDGTQLEAGFRTIASEEENYIIETRFRTGEKNIAAMIIDTGRIDAETNEPIGLGFNSYNGFHGLTNKGNKTYYNQDVYASLGAIASGLDATQWHTYKLMVNGDNVAVYIDGVYKFEHTFANSIKGGDIGIRASESWAGYNDPMYLYVDKFSVKTKAPEATGTYDYELRDNDDGVMITSRYVSGEADHGKTINAFAVIYEDGKVVAIDFKPLTLSKDGVSDKVQTSYTAKKEGSVYTARLFTWDNMMHPFN